MLNSRNLFRQFILKKASRRSDRKRVATPEFLETRSLLSAVGLASGVITFDADAGEADDVTVTSADSNTIEITVGNGDTIALGAGTGSGFVLSEADTVLTVTLDQTAETVTDLQLNLGNGDDSLVIESMAAGVGLDVDAGSGSDVVNASTSDVPLNAVGGSGNDLLIGGQADDSLSAGSGRDSLIGGPGSDTLDGGNGSDHLLGAGLVNVTVTNQQATNGGLLTPTFLSTTNGTYDFFDVGSEASSSLERLAEDGNTGPRIDAAIASGGVNEAIATSGGPIGPGESRTAVLIVDSTNDNTQYLSYASMFIPSNDAFIGNDDPQAIDLFDSNGNFIERSGASAITVTGDEVWDAGTEVNDEIPENTAALNQTVPDTGTPEDGVIAQHPGFQGSDRLGGTIGNILTARTNADFTLAGAEVAQFELVQNDGDDVLIGGRGADSLDGGEGSDSLLGGFGRDVLNGGNGDDYLDGNGQIRVTVTNLQETDGGLLTPFFLSTTNGVYDFFDAGSPASASLERLAEDGTTGPRIDAAIASGGVHEAIATDGGPVNPGQTRQVFLTATPGNDLTQYLSYASMFIPSNDAFIGNDDPQAIDLFDDLGNVITRRGSNAIFVTGDSVWDAGTEVNDEIPENTAALNQTVPNTGTTEGGVITQHPGFQGSDRLGGTTGNILTARPNADFTVADTLVARIDVDQVLDSDDIIHGGAGNDTITGGRGNDTLMGGMDDDIVRGSGGRDVVFGNDGMDSINGGAGPDTIDAGAGDDRVMAGTGNDVAYGGAGSDTLQGEAGRDQLNGGGNVTVTVTNLQQTDGGLLTPFFLATGNGQYDFFDVGSAASTSLERLAEDGNTGPRIDAAIASGGVNEAVSTSDGPLAPGESRSVELSASLFNGLTQYLSFASMFIPSNDAFIGNDDPRAIDLFDETGDLITRQGASAIVITGDEVYDAGTEENDEVPANTAALAQAAPNTGVTEGGVIAQHPGFQGSDRLGGAVGNILTARPNADFTLPDTQVASIEIVENDGADVLYGGLGNDSLSGGAGDDSLAGGFGRDMLSGGAGNDMLDGGGQITVTITNLQQTDGGLLTPTLFTTTNGVYDIFDVGGTASVSLERLAEDGNTGPRAEAALSSGGVNEAIATSGGPIAPGESRSVVLDASAFNSLTSHLSFTSMFIPSNDAFIGNDDPQAIDLFDAGGQLITRTGGSSFVVTGDDVYDAGTEVNDEVPANTAALAQAAPNTGVTENGNIAQHPGFEGSDRLGGPIGNILSARANADFTIADTDVARIEVDDALDRDDIIYGGAGDDTIHGGSGDDSNTVSTNDGTDVVAESPGTDETIVLTGESGVSVNVSDNGGVAEVAVTGGATFTVQTASEEIRVRTGAEVDNVTIGALAATNTEMVRVQTSRGNDTIDGSATDVALIVNAGSGADTILGGSGSDELRGASGDDSIDAAAGDDIVRGGNGIDEITTGVGRDIAVGGSGSDDISTGSGDDILIAGTISLSAGDVRAIQSEWLSGRDYADRVANVTGTGTGDRNNGDAFLSIDAGGPTVFDDSSADSLTGSADLDLFFANVGLDTDDAISGESVFDLS